MKFLYGDLGERQMSVLEAMIESVSERRKSRPSHLAEQAGQRPQDADVEEEEREETRLLLRAIDKKLEAAGRDKRQTPTKESQLASRWNSIGDAATEHGRNRAATAAAAAAAKEATTNDANARPQMQKSDAEEGTDSEDDQPRASWTTTNAEFQKELQRERAATRDAAILEEERMETARRAHEDADEDDAANTRELLDATVMSGAAFSAPAAGQRPSPVKNSKNW